MDSNFFSQQQEGKVKINKYVTLDHKTSHKGQFFEIDIYTSSESWINKQI